MKNVIFSYWVPVYKEVTIDLSKLSEKDRIFLEAWATYCEKDECALPEEIWENVLEMGESSPAPLVQKFISEGWGEDIEYERSE